LYSFAVVKQKPRARPSTPFPHRHAAQHFLAPVNYYSAPEYLRLGSSVGSQKGRRRTMEDEFVVASCDQLEMFAIFDGHGGIEVAVNSKEVSL
jgi:hypothetical protein